MRFKDLFTAMALLTIFTNFALAEETFHFGNPKVWQVYSGDWMKDSSQRVTAQNSQALAEFGGSDDVVWDGQNHRVIVGLKNQFIRSYNFKTKTVETLAKTPLSPAGMKLSPTQPHLLYFCSLKFFGDGVVYDKTNYDPSEKPGLYQLDMNTGEVRALLQHLPQLSEGKINQAIAVESLNESTGRPFKVCNDLDVSPDGKRLYVVESSQEDTENGPPAVAQIVLKKRDGKIWQLDLENQNLTLLGENYAFADGITLELNHKKTKERGVIFSEMGIFQITKINLSKKLKAQSEEILIDQLPGLPDGLERDEEGRIYVALFKDVTPTLLFLQEHPEELEKMKDVPYNLLPVPKQTGIVVLDPSGRTPLAFTMHDGSVVKELPSLAAARGHLFLTPFADESEGIYMTLNPFRKN